MAEQNTTVHTPQISKFHIQACSPTSIYKRLLFQYLPTVPASLEDAIYSIAEIEGLSVKDREFLLYSYALNVDLELTRKIFDALATAHAHYAKYKTWNKFNGRVVAKLGAR